MKRIFTFLTAILLCAATPSPAQDAATDEKIKKLTGLVQDLQETKESQRKQIESLSKEIQTLREQMAKPTGNYASQDDLRELAKKVQEIDNKRQADKDIIIKEIKNLAKVTNRPTPAPPKDGKKDGEKTNNPGSGEHYQHTVAQGDTISTIVQAFREQGIKVTEKQILAANPGLVPEKMSIGQKIVIPKPEK